MTRQVIVVGMAKTGTMHIAKMYQHLFKVNGIKGVAQYEGPLQMPKLNPDINFLEAAWARSKSICELSIQYPYVRFVILYRNVTVTTASLHNFATDRGKANKNLNPSELAEAYWFKVYLDLLEQLPRLQHKPFFMETKDYFAGKHNKTLLKMFNIPETLSNIESINKQLTIPINRPKSKESFVVPEKMVKRGSKIKQQLIKLCTSSWVDNPKIKQQPIKQCTSKRMHCSKKARQVIVVGMAKTGTMHIATLYRRLFKENNMEGIAQHQCPLKKLSPDINFLEAFWERSKSIYKLSMQYPYVRFVILYRNITVTTASLHNFYKDKGNPHKDLPPHALAEHYWFDAYESLLRQIPCLQHKPFLMETKDYFAGKHNETLLKMFNIPEIPKNYASIKNQLARPINRSHAKEPFLVSNEMVEKGSKIKQQLIKLCTPSWVDEL